ncbi:MAG: hypothetical protein IPH84_03605 [Bacteroidales bacterium]|nr:hypothetical protein [Bacteroidales bacterium]
MEKDERKLLGSIQRATILSGIGMGLLLGVIMGLSVSEVVKVIFGILTAMLGAFLGFDKRSFAGMESAEYQKEKENTLFTALRAGWFGIAVVAGIFLGMFVRTQEVFTISVAKSVKDYTDAGFAPDHARKLVLFQRLGIDPNTGELGPVTEVQRAHQSNLFSAEQAQELCGATDPDQWNNDWEAAQKELIALDPKIMTPIISEIANTIPEQERFAFLKGLNKLFCQLGKKGTTYCKLGTDFELWQKESSLSSIVQELSKLSPEQRQKILPKLAELVCKIENE